MTIVSMAASAVRVTYRRSARALCLSRLIAEPLDIRQKGPIAESLVDGLIKRRRRHGLWTGHGRAPPKTQLWLRMHQRSSPTAPLSWLITELVSQPMW
jgi:hypothetical protein